jgi:hypothetical protein
MIEPLLPIYTILLDMNARRWAVDEAVYELRIVEGTIGMLY